LPVNSPHHTLFIFFPSTSPSMKSFLPGPLPDNARNLLRRLGYGEHLGHGGQISFSRRTSGGNFPRFHAYVEEQNNGLQLNLHLDQKPSNLGSGAMHGGEYDGPILEQEMGRMISMIQSFRQENETGEESTPSPKKGFWKSLFGSNE